MNSPPGGLLCRTTNESSGPMPAAMPEKSLEAIRREIDAIDGQILELLARRFAATGQVRQVKAQDGSIAGSPFRPAREAAMMRRLMMGAAPDLAPGILVRLWRVILSASIQSQAPITLHMHEPHGRDLGVRVQVAEHFCGMDVEIHESPARALAVLKARRGDLALIDPASNWGPAMSATDPGSAKVISTLPVLAGSHQPQLLVFGHAEQQPSGDDETLLLFPAGVSPMAAAAWTVKAGPATLVGVPGFLMDGDTQLAAILAQHPDARVAGRYPRPIKVSP